MPYAFDKDLQFFADRIDQLAELTFYAGDKPGVPVTLPGLWFGQKMEQSWRTQRQRPNGMPGNIVHDEDLSDPRWTLKRLLLSEASPAPDLLLESFGVYGRTVYDELADIAEIFQRKDSAGAKIIWTIDNALAAAFKVDKFHFLRIRANDYKGSEAILVTLTFEAYRYGRLEV